MIKKLKRAAEFSGFTPPYIYGERNGVVLVNTGTIYELDCKIFNPHEETGRHWLVEMERKLDIVQYNEYKGLMLEEFHKRPYDEDKLETHNFSRWFKTAPSELCFEKLLEVIN